MDKINVRCKKCGGKTIVLPDNPTDASIAVCKSCGTKVGPWGKIKAAALEITKEQVEKDIKNAFRGIDGFK